MHDARKNDPAKPQLFKHDPTYSMFRRAIVMPDFSKVVFHPIAGIGRCPTCQYLEWTCASVPLQLRGVWQGALAHHHAIQIEQTHRYVAARARAASQYPAIELYMAIAYNIGL